MSRNAILIFTGLLTVAPLIAVASEGRLEARYTVYFNAIEVGRGALSVEIAKTGYSASGNGAVTGMLQLLHKGEGSAEARGTIVDGKVLPASYSGKAESGSKTDEVRFELAGGIVRDVSLDPPLSSSRRRIALTDEHRVDVVDPLSAAIMPVPGDADPTGRAACDRTLEIYDGRYRYDLVMQFERTDVVNDISGYSGALAVCRVRYRPIAGHNPERRETKQAVENRNVFVWLAPIADLPILAPARVSVGSTLGTLVVQATRFSGRPRTRAEAGAK